MKRVIMFRYLPSWLKILLVIALLFLLYDLVKFKEASYDLKKIDDWSSSYESIEAFRMQQMIEGLREFDSPFEWKEINTQIFPKINSRYFDVDFVSVDQFKQYCRRISAEEILIFENDIKEEMNTLGYSTYLYKEVRKPVFRRLFTQYDDWVLIYKLKYLNKKLFYNFTWNEGDGTNFYQLSIENYPPQDVSNLTRKITVKLEELIDK